MTAAVLAIANSSAGTASDTSLDIALDVLREHHDDVRLETTSSPDDLTDALARHDDVGIVVALGGDGSLHAVVAALHDAGRLKDVAVGLVPLGTGNDFARSVDLPNDPAAAAEIVATGEPRPLDLIVEEQGTVIVNAAHLGAGTEAALAAKPLKERFGPIGYALGALVSGFRVEGKHLTITIDGEPVRAHGRVLQVAVGNGRFVGAGTALLPEADPADGLMDVAIVLSHSRRKRLGYLLSLGLRRHHRRDDVLYVRGAEVVVEGAELASTNDGEIADPMPRHHWRIEPGVLRMYVP